MATTRSDVWEALSGMDTPGDTSAGGASVLPALPGLEVDGVGPVALPLNDVQAKALAAVAVQAPSTKRDIDMHFAALRTAARSTSSSW